MNDYITRDLEMDCFHSWLFVNHLALAGMDKIPCGLLNEGDFKMNQEQEKCFGCDCMIEEGDEQMIRLASGTIVPLCPDCMGDDE